MMDEDDVNNVNIKDFKEGDTIHFFELVEIYKLSGNEDDKRKYRPKKAKGFVMESGKLSGNVSVAEEIDIRPYYFLITARIGGIRILKRMGYSTYNCQWVIGWPRMILIEKFIFEDQMSYG